MKAKKIIISVTSDLSTDHRVQKTAKTLFEEGFEVLLVGRKMSNSLPFSSAYSHQRLRLLFNSSLFFYAEYNIRLFFLLLLSKADIFLSNDLDTLLANVLAGKIRRKKIIYDSHELFTEVPELEGRNFVKSIWNFIERHCLPKVDASFTVCQSIANYYSKKYNIAMDVVRNIPENRLDKHLIPKLSFPSKKIILYQGALNIGRGIEWVIEAMSFIDEAVLVIIGKGDISNTLKRIVKEKKLQRKVLFLGHIAHRELLSYTISANLGICLLKNSSLSYYFSLPNRIFDLMYARVPILASNFPEIANVINTHHTGKVIDNHQPKFLAETIKQMLCQPIQKEVFDKAIETFNWENEKKNLLRIFQKCSLS